MTMAGKRALTQDQADRVYRMPKASSASKRFSTPFSLENPIYVLEPLIKARFDFLKILLGSTNSLYFRPFKSLIN